MAKIITKDTSTKTKKNGVTDKASDKKTDTVFQRNITTEVKGIKSVLVNNEKTIKDIHKALNDLSVKLINKNYFGNGGSNDKSDLSGATEDNEEKKKQAGTYKLNETVQAMHKDLMSVLGLNKKSGDKEKKKGESWLSGLFNKVFSLGNLFKAALATLPFIFKDVLHDLISKGLEKIGVGKELSSKIADYLEPAVQGAALGYALGGWKGAVAGAVIGVGYKMVNDMVNEWKAENGSKKVLGFLEVEGLGRLTKNVITGAAIGFGISGIKGVIAGALIGAVAGSVHNLIGQWNKDIKNPQEQTTTDIFGGLARGAFYGAITGAVIGGKFGGLKGMLIGLAAGAIVGGAAGLISKLISDFKATHAKDKEYNKNSEINKAAVAGKQFSETDATNTQFEISKLEEKLEKTEDEEEKKKLKREIKNKKIDLNTINNQLERRKRLSTNMKLGKKSDIYFTKDGKMVDMKADIGFWRGASTWLGRNLFGQGDLSSSEIDKIMREGKAAGKSSEEIQQMIKEAGEAKLKEYNARRILNSELKNSTLTYGNAEEQEKLKTDYDYALETANIGRNMSLDYQSNAKKEAKLNASIDKTQDFVIESANEQTYLLRQLVELAGGNKNSSSYSLSSVSNSSNMSIPQIERP